MPLTRDGELTIVASSALGGLGAMDGPGVIYQWTRPSLLPPLLPWLGVLALLALRPNRSSSAWWIWVPLGCVFLVEAGMGVLTGMVPSEVVDILRQVVHALAFGAAAVWLLAPLLGGRYRFLVFLKVVLLQAGVGLLVWILHQDWSGFDSEQLVVLMAVGILSVVIAAALCLTGFNCRHALRPARFLLWLLVWLLVGVAVLLMPFALIAAVAQGIEVLLPFVISTLLGAGVCLALLLPFLVLSLGNNFHSERIREMLQMGLAAPPPLLAPAAPAPAI